MKRKEPESSNDNNNNSVGEEKAVVSQQQEEDNNNNEMEEMDDELDDDEPNPYRRREQKQQRFCPYLDTINRHALDFDFEKVCSVTNSNLNVYACLVCGKFFQGRSRNTPAYYHALENSHHVFIKLSTERVYCIPENYEVLDASLNDIKYVLNPTYTKEQVAAFNTEMKFCRGLDGSEYIAGTVGLNNIKNTDYVNVVVQALSRVTPVRNYFVTTEHVKNVKSPVVQCFGELLRKMWSPRNFKGHVSPHELLQAISIVSNKRYRFDLQSDPIELMAWFLNALHAAIGGTRAPGSSIIHQSLQGCVRCETKPHVSVPDGQASVPPQHTEFLGSDVEVKEIPFLFLTLDLPPVPLYKDDQLRNIIPQVPLVTILNKFDGRTVQEDLHGNRRRYIITKLPQYLILHMKRFVRNTQQLVEKNITIVNFPVKNLDMKDYCAPGAYKEGESTKYNLIANICHEGRHNDGFYKVHVIHKPNDSWYELQDLHLQEILPQMVAISESYIQIYERQQ